jgi:hypothetical protein
MGNGEGDSEGGERGGGKGNNQNKTAVGGVEERCIGGPVSVADPLR